MIMFRNSNNYEDFWKFLDRFQKLVKMRKSESIIVFEFVYFRCFKRQKMSVKYLYMQLST